MQNQLTGGKDAPVCVIERSLNSKVGECSATYAPQSTCPKSCPFMKSGCYAESGHAGIVTGRLNRNAKGRHKETLARIEADGIRQLSGELPLRIHVVGDATTDQCAKILADAAKDHRAKSGKPVWSYTHSWRDVKRKSWGDVSVLASTENPVDAGRAMRKGYATAMVVPSHLSDKAYSVNGIKVIPCPQQTGRAKDCVSCGLCMRDKNLRAANAVIGFAVHGSGATKAANALNIIQ